MADTEFNARVAPPKSCRSQSAEDVMSQARIVRSIDAPAQEVWETLRDFDGVDEYLPSVASCAVEGSGIGARRVCTLQDGSRVFERLVTIDEQKRTLRYSVTQSQLPFESYLGTITVRDLGERKCRIDWSSTFDPIGMPEAQVISMIESMYSEAVEGLERLHSLGTSGQSQLRCSRNHSHLSKGGQHSCAR